MKRLLLPALATTALLLIPGSAAAQQLQPSTDLSSLLKITTPDTPNITIPKPKAKTPEQPKPQPEIYTVVDGDNLTKIGTAHNTEWQRLWSKNTQLTDPDLIHVGDQITIPEAGEQIAAREVPANTTLPAVTPGVSAGPAVQPRTAAGVYGPGNTYDYGYCTWYVKNKRGSTIPNSLGNANTWYSRAAALGMAVGSAPRAGAVGTTTRGSLGHVVYVESVNSDGSINISEMNASAGFGAVDYRTAPASEFSYIY